MIFYKRFLADYTAATASLTLAQHGALNLLLDHFYMTERPLPRDREALYRLVRAFDPSEREAVDSVLAEFWTETADGWRNGRADRVLAEWRNRSATARKSAESRWERNATAHADAMRTHSDGTCESDASQSPEAQKTEAQKSENQPGSDEPSSSRGDDPQATGWHFRGQHVDAAISVMLARSGEAMTVDAVRRETGIASGTVRKSLARLVRARRVDRTGEGTKFDPHRYRARS